jgi:hypothetical protein
MAPSKGITGGIKDYKKLVKKLENINKDSEKAIKRTVSDLKSRAPAQVTKAATATYGIKSGDVTKAGKIAKGTAKVIKSSQVVDTIQLTYEGRPLTPTHFKMKPTTRPMGIKDENGNTIKRARKQTITAEIFKGQRKGLGPNVFLGSNGSGGDIPFQRKGAGRLPIEGVKTLSIPQMITNEKVSKEIQENLDELLLNRLNHNVEQALK